MHQAGADWNRYPTLSPGPAITNPDQYHPATTETPRPIRRVGTLLSTSFNSGVSIEVVRRRLGHASTETTQVYTLLANKVADTEIRAARRKREMRRR